ncbi:hypothetical protein BpHYR1_052300 [Brachionus plicatilis]|uniref:Uncharacterized protein n=1 Tax=Brachionus plicatilis TaxID=10195 RepID=A0A3M7QTH8_BRAPC|nr:hypothetical protein BpHYR1_052300 [Brachionus plicatilis]
MHEMALSAIGVHLLVLKLSVEELMSVGHFEGLVLELESGLDVGCVGLVGFVVIFGLFGFWRIVADHRARVLLSQLLCADVFGRVR